MINLIGMEQDGQRIVRQKGNRVRLQDPETLRFSGWVKPRGQVIAIARAMQGTQEVMESFGRLGEATLAVAESLKPTVEHMQQIEEDRKHFESFTVNELKAFLDGHNIAYKSKMRKAELVDLALEVTQEVIER